MKNLFIAFLLLISIVTIANPAVARDLASAAQAAQTQFNRIGVAAIGIGVTVGGILFVVGLAHIGRYILFSALTGAVCILGGPAIISLLSRIFGA